MSSTRRDTSTGTQARTRAGRAARTRRAAALLAAVAATGLVVAGCAGGSDDSSEAYSTTQAAPSAESEAGTEQEAGDGAEGSAAEDSAADGASRDGSAGSGSDAAGQDEATVTAQSARKLARSGSLDLEVEDVTRTSARVRSVADRAGGWVSQEDSSSRATDGEDDDAPDGADAYPSVGVPGAWSEITVQVPASAMEKAMDDLAELGTVTHRTTETEDVTAAHTDATTRVETLTRSTERLRELIEDSDDLEQIVSLESELTTREGELESMTRQLDTLEERTATSPITVSIAEEGAAASAEDEGSETGFVAGLSDGWGAFTGALRVGATVLGALTPFVLAGGLVLAPVLWWWRRRPRRATPVPAAPTAPAE